VSRVSVCVAREAEKREGGSEEGNGLMAKTTKASEYPTLDPLGRLPRAMRKQALSLNVQTDDQHERPRLEFEAHG
jgi:hypothetical protein